mgnify:CR=1 FL=1
MSRTAGMSAGPAPELTTLRVLVVEDADDAREALAHLLRAAGAEVTTAATAAEALARAREQRFDLLLTDLGLPDLPGDRVIGEFLTLAGSPRPRVVAVTGHGEPLVGRARRAGADAVLAKPVEWATLLAALTPPRRLAA